LSVGGQDAAAQNCGSQQQSSLHRRVLSLLSSRQSNVHSGGCVPGGANVGHRTPRGTFSAVKEMGAKQRRTLESRHGFSNSMAAERPAGHVASRVPTHQGE
jgi:hypothetical protein